MALIAAATTAVGIAAFSGVSAAHSPNVNATCTGLSVDLWLYTASADGPNNKVTITIDGTSHVAYFDSGFSETFPWPQTADHTWSVVVDADLDSGGTDWDLSAGGTQHACESAPTTTQPPETTVPETTVPETTVPETTVPATTVPETTVPETTAPPTTAVATITTPTTQPTDDCAITASDAGEVGVSCAAGDVAEAGSPEIAEINAPATVVALTPAAVDPAADVPAATVAAAAATNPSVSVPADTTLPVTGIDTGLQLAIGLAAVGIGTALAVVARRRSRPSTDV